MFGYLEIDPNGITDNSTGYNLFVRFGNWILIFTYFSIKTIICITIKEFCPDFPLGYSRNGEIHSRHPYFER